VTPLLTWDTITPPQPYNNGRYETVPFYVSAFGPADTIYASNGPMLYMSSDLGKDWQRVYYAQGDLTGIFLSPDFASDQTMILTTDQGVFISSDGGTMFDNTGLPVGSTGYEVSFSPAYAQDGTIAVAVPGTGVYLSRDRGKTWRDVFPHKDVTAVAMSARALYVGTNYLIGQANGVYASFDYGDSWTNLGLQKETIQTLLVGNPQKDGDLVLAVPVGELPLSAVVPVSGPPQKAGGSTQAATAGGQAGSGGTGTLIVVFKPGSYSYQVNGKNLLMDVAPYIEAASGRMYVPVRYLAESLGISPEDIAWNGLTDTVTLTKGNVELSLTIGSKDAVLWSGNASGEMSRRDEVMDVAPVIVEGRTMLPARYVAEAFGYHVSWDPERRVVTITR